LRIVFFGTPEFAVPSLEAVASEHEVILAVAQPDRPAGRGMHTQSPPVAVRARDLGIDVVQPAKIRDPQFLKRIEQLAPDAAVVVAYGRILPANLLFTPRHGFFNVHASLLPKYRGAAPIQRAIEAGETTTGVSIMRVDEALDHGPVLAIQSLNIEPDDHTPSLALRLSQTGANALVRSLADVMRGRAKETPQDHSRATYAARIEKSEGQLTWNVPARDIYNKFRAFDPWPGVTIGGLKLIDIRSGVSPATSAAPGTIIEITNEAVIVATSDGTLKLLRVQRPGKAPISAPESARASGWRVGARL
jgi:methionyl-tRNA formyltransferase